MKKTTFCENYQLEEFLADGGFAMFCEIYKKYNYACQMEKEDCYQEYSIAAARAIREYNPHRVDVKLFTYVWRCVENEAKMICRREMAKKRASNINPVAMSRIERYFEDERSGSQSYSEQKSYRGPRWNSPFEYMSDDDDVEYYFEDDWGESRRYPELESYERLCSDSTFKQVLDNDGVERFYRVVDNAGLTPLEREIITLSIRGLTQQEIGAHTHYTQSRISKYKNDACRKLWICLEVMA